MKIEVQIEPGCREPRVVIHTDRMTDEISTLLARLEAAENKPLVGFSEGTATVLAPEALLRVYVENGRTMAHTEQGTYALKGPLYEWEQRLDPRAFVRVSQSEIIHLKKVKAFDLNLAGTVLVRLTDGTVTYASRRYVAKIKTLLGL